MASSSRRSSSSIGTGCEDTAVSFWSSPLMRRLRPGIGATLDHTEPYAAAWAAANEQARTTTGPMWVVLGDSTAQGIGAPAHDRGYVGQLRRRLEDRDGRTWRVVNLSRTGARVDDVITQQLPALDDLASRADMVTCAVGANDLVRLRFTAVPARFRLLIERLPPGSVVATLPRGLGGRRAERVNAMIRAEAPPRGLVVADVWAHTGPPWQGKFAGDDFHPNEVGYRDWADAFADALGLGEA
jgi:lysophospholipase L1-like esterase